MQDVLRAGVFNIAGLTANMAGVVLLFCYGMPGYCPNSELLS
jgi:hypothetical protein